MWDSYILNLENKYRYEVFYSKITNHNVKSVSLNFLLPFRMLHPKRIPGLCDTCYGLGYSTHNWQNTDVKLR